MLGGWSNWCPFGVCICNILSPVAAVDIGWIYKWQTLNIQCIWWSTFGNSVVDMFWLLHGNLKCQNLWERRRHDSMIMCRLHQVTLHLIISCVLSPILWSSATHSLMCADYVLGDHKHWHHSFLLQHLHWPALTRTCSMCTKETSRCRFGPEMPLKAM